MFVAEAERVEPCPVSEPVRLSPPPPALGATNCGDTVGLKTMCGFLKYARIAASGKASSVMRKLPIPPPFCNLYELPPNSEYPKVACEALLNVYADPPLSTGLLST